MVTAGGYHSLAVVGPANKTIYAWGSGVYGELGNGESNN